MKTNLVLTAALSLSLCAASTAQTLPAYLPTDGLVGWWPLNGNANDESGNGNNGTVNGATLTEDRFGNIENSYFFNGLGNGISLENNTFPIGNSSRSISVWFKMQLPLTNLTSSVLILYGNNTLGERFALCYSNGEVKAEFVNSYVGYPFTPDSAWHNFIVTYPINGLGSSSIKLYLDGTLLLNYNIFNPVTSFNTSANATNGLTNSVGTLYDLPGYFWGGKLDDIAIYNRALTPEEITALYTGEPVNPPTACNPLPSNLQNGLVGYWPFCGNANDESGNGNDGTVNGATLAVDRFGDENSAYSFDGVDDFITGTISDLNSTSTTTVSAWIKYIGDAGGHPYDSYFQLGNYGSHTFAYAYNYSGQNLDLYSQCFANPYTEINLNNSWHNVIVVDSLNSTKVYVDGELLTEFLWGGNSNCYSGSSQFYIGGPGDNQHTTGSLDDIGIWNRALTAEEVQQLYTLNACTFTVYDTVTVTQTIYDTVTTYTTVTDTLIINTLITELAPPANTNTIKVFPNPAGSILTIDYGNFALMNGYQLRIENSLGQQVFQTNISQQSDTLSLGSWGGNGLYFVHIVDPQGNTVDIRKIVLQ